MVWRINLKYNNKWCPDYTNQLKSVIRENMVHKQDSSKKNNNKKKKTQNPNKLNPLDAPLRNWGCGLKYFKHDCIL